MTPANDPEMVEKLREARRVIELHREALDLEIKRGNQAIIEAIRAVRPILNIRVTPKGER